MTDDGAPSAASERLIDLVVRADELAGKRRFEPAVAKLEEAAALARETMPPQSLLRAYALLRHADCTLAQQMQLRSRSVTGSGVDRATYAAEQALCAASYASLREALPILFARAEANTLLPGCVPADEEESFLRVILLAMSAAAREGAKGDYSPAAVAARMAKARASRRGQCQGYLLYFEAAFVAFLALYPSLMNSPFPPRTDETEQQDVDMLCNCIMTAVHLLGDSCDGGPPDDAANGVQWQLVGFPGSLAGSKLCNLVTTFMDAAAQGLIQPEQGFISALRELWHSPQLARRRMFWADTNQHLSAVCQVKKQRAAADVARHGLATCARPDCTAVESCPKAFKTCARCHSVVYCSRECQLAAWPSHKRDCKRLAAQRDADANA